MVIAAKAVSKLVEEDGSMAALVYDACVWHSPQAVVSKVSVKVPARFYTTTHQIEQNKSKR